MLSRARKETRDPNGYNILVIRQSREEHSQARL